MNDIPFTEVFKLFIAFLFKWTLIFAFVWCCFVLDSIENKLNFIIRSSRKNTKE
jgi:hypothetical protein